MTNVLVEAGGQVLGSFFDESLVNEVHAFVAPVLVGGQAAPSPIRGIGVDLTGNATRLDRTSIQMLDGDVYIHGFVPEKL